jgi:hypothetical protein
MSISPYPLAPCEACGADPGQPCNPDCLGETDAAIAACRICSTGGDCEGCDACDAHEDQPCALWCEYAEEAAYEDQPETPSPYEEPVTPGW